MVAKEHDYGQITGLIVGFSRKRNKSNPIIHLDFASLKHFSILTPLRFSDEKISGVVSAG